MPSTKIVATIGPASREEEVLERMIAAGMDVARLNFAHQTPEYHAETTTLLRRAAGSVGREVGILMDVPGPKLRIGPIAGDICELRTGTRVTLTTEPGEGDATRIPLSFTGLPELLEEGDVAYIADGAIRLRVRTVAETEAVADVEVGGPVASRQGMNLPNVNTALPAVSEDDLALIDAGIEMGVDFLALSFVRRAQDLEPVRERLASHGRDLPVLAKIEKPQAAESAEQIVDAADGIMVARGDLGIELPIEQVPLVQKRLLRVAGQRAKPSITATQMLESMVNSSRPTRAEVADVANAIFDGTDAVMLSQETAIGKHPVGSVEMMAAIAAATERELPYWRYLAERGPRGGDESVTIAYGAVAAVDQLDLRAIVAPTMTGRVARLISAHRPRVPVLALSPRLDVVRRCSLLWGVRAELNEEPRATTDLIEECGAAAARFGMASRGDRIGITAGLPAGHSGGTNMFKVHTLT